MAQFLLLMHSDANGGGDWDAYFEVLRASGRFLGGSEIGEGACFRKDGQARDIAGHLGGYIKVEAESLEAVQAFLPGNPVYETGGTVEIRELPES